LYFVKEKQVKSVGAPTVETYVVKIHLVYLDSIATHHFFNMHVS